MQEKARGNKGFQCQYLIKAFCVFSFINKITPDAEIDAEDRHGQFGTEGKSYGKLFAEWRTIKFLISILQCIIVSSSGNVIF